MTEQTLLQHTLDCFWETIPPTWNAVRSHVRQVAAEEFGMTVEQFHSLRLIRRGLKTACEIADAKQISRPAVSQAVDVLVEKGLVQRKRSQSDRRYVELELTEDGSRLLDEIFSRSRLWMASKMQSLNPVELRTLIDAMTLLGDAFKGSGE
jgi:MarR family 2-MHQ and catechol resistance regulon transcriptional repressor